MSTPAIIILVLQGLSLLVVSNKHGQPKGNHDIRWTIFGVALNIFLLYWGGFFK